ncbi:unnamed protein product, partial [Mesorhabditis spiculigera]
MRRLLIFLLCIQRIWAALDTAAVISIQNELNKHAQELEMLLEHVKNLNIRVTDLGRPGSPGINGSPGFPGSKGAKGDNGEDGMPGKPGMQGMPGIKGDLGPIGPAGLKGDKVHFRDFLGRKEIEEKLERLVGREIQIGLPGLKGDGGPPGYPGAKGDSGKDGLPGLPGWLVNDKGYCILALGNCPPSFTQIGAYQTHVENYRFGDYSLVKTASVGGNEEQFALKVHACCR